MTRHWIKYYPAFILIWRLVQLRVETTVTASYRSRRNYNWQYIGYCTYFVPRQRKWKQVQLELERCRLDLPVNLQPEVVRRISCWFNCWSTSWCTESWSEIWLHCTMHIARRPAVVGLSSADRLMPGGAYGPLFRAQPTRNADAYNHRSFCGVDPRADSETRGAWPRVERTNASYSMERAGIQSGPCMKGRLDREIVRRNGRQSSACSDQAIRN